MYRSPESAGRQFDRRKLGPSVVVTANCGDDEAHQDCQRDKTAPDDEHLFTVWRAVPKPEALYSVLSVAAVDR